MKRRILSLSLLLMLVLAMGSINCLAQDEPAERPIPRWVSDKGYWQVVSNIKDPENFVVYFFNNEGVVVYQEKVEGVKLDLKKKKNLMRLKRELEQSVVAWEKHGIPKPLVAKTGHFGDKWAVESENRHK